MNQWMNPSHPQTLQAAVFLGYLSALFGLLFTGSSILFLPLFLGMGVGAFVTANNRRWGYLMLAVCATIIACLDVWFLAARVLSSYPVASILAALNATVFPVALAAAVLHTQSREYQKVWFE